MSWTWSSNRHQRETIEELAEGFQRALLELIAHCRSRKSSSFTPSDFAAAQLSQSELDLLLDDLNENDKLAPNGLSDICGLSPMQEGMLFESLLAPDIGRYVVQVCFSMQPSIDIGVFRKCWAYVIERHSILRTSFYWDKIAVPAQLEWRQIEVPFECLDWLGLSGGAQQEQWSSLLSADRKRGFDLASPPPMRLTLVRTSENACRFLWSFHHILLDGWSTFSILKEVFSFYEAFSQGRELQLPRSRNYKDYISWLQEKDLASAESFWREKLSGFTAPTQLRVSGGRKEQAGGGVEAEAGHNVVSIRLSEERAAEVRGFARRRQLTLNTLAQGAWAILLSRYSGVEDVLFGATVSGRSEGLAGIEEMAGLFINTLPVRVRARPDHGVVKWLKQLQEYNVEMMRFEYSPLVQVQGWSDVPRGQQLFETILVFENYPINNSFIDNKGQILIDEFESYDDTNYALVFLVDAYKDVVLNLRYDRNHFSADVIQRMLEHLRILLEGMAADPEGRLGDLPIMSEVEREQVLVKWNETEREYPRDKCVHQLFEEQVERGPDAVAVVFGDEMLSYGELNRRANQLAHYLRGLGVGPEVRVALCLGRKLEAVVGILGILKAGGAYLPIEPEQPAARLAGLLDDAQAPVALTEEAVRDRLQAHLAQVLSLDGDWEEIATQSRANPARIVKPANAAYVIYTSGSTGRPKGVEIEHRQLVHYIEAITEGLELSAGMKMALVSTFAADLGHTVLFPALGVGGELHVIDREEVLSGSALGEYFERKEIDVVKLTPSHLRALLEGGGRGVVPRRLVALGGEACGWELVEQVQQLRPECRVVNHYGPTENTVGGIMREVGACAEGERSVSVPLGRPLRNVRAYVLDRSGEPAPVGVCGELYLGGKGVGRGYVNEAPWTAERFVPDPFSGVDGGRMYRTGDQVRWSGDGELEFLGRVDQQVKIRGYRIEPGEIEAVLREHAGVRQSAVVAHETESGEKQLIGYVAGGEAAGGLSAEQVREYLAGLLPGYMVPGRIVVMDTLPLTPNGKLNRRALPFPDGHWHEAEGGYEAPRTAVEGKLAEIWGQLLHQERVGIHDNFFALGGHSLILTRLSSKIAGEFGVKPTLRDLFDATTIVKMTILIANLQLSAMSPDDLFTLIQTLPNAN
jgi:amino acid adenylation domain-containing protein